MIRQAKAEDVGPILRLAVVMHAESNFSTIPLSEPHVAKYIRALIDSDNGLVLVSETAGGIDGGIMAMCVPAWFSNGLDMIADEIALFVMPEARGNGVAVDLVASFKRWAQNFGAMQIRAGTAAGVAGKAAGRIYESLGFECTGGCYLLDLTK